MTKFVSVLAIVVASFVLAPAASADGGQWLWPLANSHETGRLFDPPDTDYSAGHRGLDLPGDVGDTLIAVADGTVVFAGSVAGVGVVVIDHGSTKSTYQPVISSVGPGQAVHAGQKIGNLVQRGSHCSAWPCLHLGRKIDDRYADPLELLPGPSTVRLLNPRGAPPAPPFALAGSGVLARPVHGRITSEFGQRTHPITGVRKLHNGTDFGVRCGTPVHVAARGIVKARYFNAGYGNRIIVTHPGGLETSYNHLSRYGARTGDRLDAGDVVGYVGSSGYSTGCHLHFMVAAKGRVVDPAEWL